MTKVLGSDIGGTFTDFALLDESSGRIRIHKRLTTPDDPSSAVAGGMAALAEAGLADVAAHVHGTTLVINAVIERRGACTGLITTRGFRDVLAIGREKRYDAYDLRIAFPEPLVPRVLRVEVRERMHMSGQVLEPLDAESVRAAVARLLARGVESIAVCLLHAYDLARRLGIGTVLVPPRAGVASAVGMIVAPISYDAVRSHRTALASADLGHLEALFTEMAKECVARIAHDLSEGLISEDYARRHHRFPRPYD